ncbi:hypothetical protein TNCV_2350151 [Trichonephila clavipes]|uniref:Uncharacterized protein n=1 Tax=Trichonephila clavipes TaxID=2585209 RepID=A0A8X6SXX9_TRICX|nr:hypothetical protein TNCV_2350151 [Trichonephila clavipes]
MDHVILNHGQVMWTTPELAPPSPNYHTNGRTFQLSTDLTIQPAKDMPLPAELLIGRKLRTFLPSHPGKLKPTFDVERAREAMRKRQIIQNKYANKHATVTTSKC